MQLYAHITFIFENMTKNSKNAGKREFFDQKFDQMAYQNLIC